MKLKQLVIMTVLLLPCLLCSCANGGKKMNTIISASDKSLIDLTSKIYEKSQLEDIVMYNRTISELNIKYPIECMRDNNGMYRVSYLGDECIAMLLFDNSGNNLSGEIYNTKLQKSDFDSLTEGQSLEDVRVLDPDGKYLFLFTGRNDIPRVSSHITKDGYIIFIEYDESNSIISITEELI